MSEAQPQPHYLSLHAIVSELEELERTRFDHPHLNLSVVMGIWNAILTWQFPADKGYILRASIRPRPRWEPESPPLSDMYVLHYGQGRGHLSRKFLAIHCKRSRLERLRAMWQEGLRELFSRISPSNDLEANTVFGIVAIGKYVKFYEHNPASGQTINFSMPGYSQGTGEHPLHVVADAELVQSILNYIRDHQLRIHGE